MAGQVVDKKKKVVVVVAVVVATVAVVVVAAVVVVVVVAVVVVAAVVVAALETGVELVGWPTCWKKERPASFSSSGHAWPSPGRAYFCSDPSHFRPPFLQKHKLS